MTAKKNARVAHWDAMGKPILDFFGMRDYYARDSLSTRILSSFLPHQYRVIPDLSIRFCVSDPREWVVRKVYPAGNESCVRVVGARALEWARAIYKKPMNGWTCEKAGEYITLSKPGRLAIEGNKYFGPVE